MTVDTEGFVDLNKIPPETPVMVTEVLEDKVTVKASVVGDDEVMAEYLTVPKVRAVMSARVFPPADTLMSMGELVTSTVMAPDVQPKIVHAVKHNAVHTFKTVFRIRSSLKINKKNAYKMSGQSSLYKIPA
jgi:hypothetical protein